MKRLIVLPLMAVCVCAAPSHAGDVYTWKDKSGRVHYADQPPPGVDAKLVTGIQAPTAPAPSGSTPATGSKALAEQNRSFAERRAAQADKDKAEADAAAREAQKRQYCESLRQRLAALETGGRLARVVDGERVVMTDEERSAELAKTRSQLTKDCGAT